MILFWRNKAQIRWDYLIGALIGISVLILGVIIYIYLKGNGSSLICQIKSAIFSGAC